MADATAVCVLGMHRSGTSLVAGMLQALGVELGPAEHLMPATANNPRGYFENQHITDINDELLARLGGTWDVPPRMSPEAFAQPGLADLRRTARKLLAQEFGASELWGWKDPRTCLVVPFWELLVPSPRFVLCLRNPADVTRSLARSDDVSRGIELWLRYTSDSLAFTLGKPRLLVFYEDMLTDSRGGLERLAAFVGASADVESASRELAQAGLVDPNLCHHAEPLADTLDDPRIPLAAKALYLVLRLSNAAPPALLEHGAIEAFAAAASGAPAASVPDATSLLREIETR